MLLLKPDLAKNNTMLAKQTNIKQPVQTVYDYVRILNAATCSQNGAILQTYRLPQPGGQETMDSQDQPKGKMDACCPRQQLH